MPSLRDAALAIAALGQSSTKDAGQVRTICEAVQDLSYRLQALEAVVGAVAKRAGVAAAEVNIGGGFNRGPREEAIGQIVREILK